MVFASHDLKIIVKTTVFASHDAEIIAKTTVFASRDAEIIVKTTAFASRDAENMVKTTVLLYIPRDQNGSWLKWPTQVQKLPQGTRVGHLREISQPPRAWLK